MDVKTIKWRIKSIISFAKSIEYACKKTNFFPKESFGLLVEWMEDLEEMINENNN